MRPLFLTDSFKISSGELHDKQPTNKLYKLGILILEQFRIFSDYIIFQSFQRGITSALYFKWGLKISLPLGYAAYI
jgi:hypothetical protein